MRDLQKNTFQIWCVNPSVRTEVMDGEYHTGEYKSTCGTPRKARISMYPANARITEELFGKNVALDMIASSSTLDFPADTLIFMSSPSGDYSKTYDYKVSAISPSINSTTYGLKKRT